MKKMYVVNVLEDCETQIDLNGKHHISQFHKRMRNAKKAMKQMIERAKNYLISLDIKFKESYSKLNNCYSLAFNEGENNESRGLFEIYIEEMEDL